MKRIALLGSTGSIGVNCLKVVEAMPDQFRVVALASHRNVPLLIEQARKFRPLFVAVSAPENDFEVDGLKNLGVAVLQGEKALLSICQEAEYDLLVNAVVGAVGFEPTLAAIERGKPVALANKEALVIGGELVSRAARRHGVEILPIDSEHSAIFQCLMGEDRQSIEEIILTGSGGPFRTWSEAEMRHATVAEALKHPNWSMGRKITIDSATMMNKGLEVIEAHWLFGLPAEKIRVVVHPQSIIHSMVVFQDGSVKAQLGVPDMRLPIQFALTYPHRRPSHFPRLNFAEATQLTFEQPDMKKFPALSLAYQALAIGGTAPAVMNAANEMAVHLFLEEKIGFMQIAKLIELAISSFRHDDHPDAGTLLAADRWAREFVEKQAVGK